MRVFALRPYQPSARRVYPPAVVPERRLPQIGVAASRGVLRRYVRVEQADELEMRVRAPARRLRTWANGRMVRHRLVGGFAVFRLDTTSGAAADWAVTWGGSS